MKNTYKLMLFVCVMLVATLTFTAAASAKQYGVMVKTANSGSYISALSNGGSLSPLTYRLPNSPLTVEVTLPNGYNVGVPTKVILVVKYKNGKFRPKIGWKKRYKTTYFKAFGKRKWPIVPTVRMQWDSVGAIVVPFKKIYLGPRQTKTAVLWVTFPECLPPGPSFWYDQSLRSFGLTQNPGWMCSPADLDVGFKGAILKSRRIKIAGKMWQWTLEGKANAPQRGIYLYPPPSPPAALPSEPTPTGPTGPTG
ncbi:hypothetical protein A3F64_01640 [Candidatus Saccharibacteria bacterium RIFCSPHIGHO2_12_FULL_42_8]|nr:MAG: hypothetical protein A3F64_01640 [Candidatus Saccharibacteria bacterium RIFCSPHIGHO2_12_FULL_42_8]